MNNSTTPTISTQPLKIYNEQIAMMIYLSISEERQEKLLSRHSATMRTIWEQTRSALSEEYRYHEQRFWWLDWIFYRLRRRKFMNQD